MLFYCFVPDLLYASLSPPKSLDFVPSTVWLMIWSLYYNVGPHMLPSASPGVLAKFSDSTIANKSITGNRTRIKTKSG